ncbi:MAG: 16S rRNA pseudouridine(516) synthase [Gammaproteobacteria bacterium]|nr:16S rRNA pseudouridine(516) synthase [Gammaproteobacteria bacterium]MBU1414681.1 16S rRNA pseudouridine(516) synthase [Gammaproteobacteria bacterium]
MKTTSLDKILQSQGFGTRRECREMIQAGFVCVGGELVSRYDAGFDPEGLEFSVHGEPWTYREKLYIALNKPSGYECSRKPSHHPGVMSLLPDPFLLRGVQAVGRLDHDTTGLLLLSDDGAFIHALSSPKRHVPKLYVATTAEPVTEALIAQLQRGVKLHDEPAPLKAEVRQLDKHTLEMVLEQGKYHQVKRMLAAAGNHCTALRRTAIGDLTLDSLGLADGGWSYIEPAQVMPKPA